MHVLHAINKHVKIAFISSFLQLCLSRTVIWFSTENIRCSKEQNVLKGNQDGIPYPWRTWAQVTTFRKPSTWADRGAAPDSISRTFPPNPCFTWCRWWDDVKRCKMSQWSYTCRAFWGLCKSDRNILGKWNRSGTLNLHHLTENNFVTYWWSLYMFIPLPHVVQLAAANQIMRVF